MGRHRHAGARAHVVSRPSAIAMRARATSRPTCSCGSRRSTPSRPRRSRPSSRAPCDLDARDRALATELVYGTLRVAPWLEAQIARRMRRAGPRSSTRTCARAWRSRRYQLFFMRVPGVRRRQRGGAGRPRSRADRASRRSPTRCFARWRRRRRSARAPEGADAQLLGRGDGRVDAGSGSATRSSGRSATRARARFSGAPWSRPPWRSGSKRRSSAGGARRVGRAPPARRRPTRRSSRAARRRSPSSSRGAGKPQKLPGFAEGAWSVQEEGSQVAALALGAATRRDACSTRARGAATRRRCSRAPSATAERSTRATRAPRSSSACGEELARVGLRARATFAVDWSVGSGDVTGAYDRVLVDAPCTGVGTLRRRPEIALRRKPERPRRPRPRAGRHRAARRDARAAGRIARLRRLQRPARRGRGRGRRAARGAARFRREGARCSAAAARPRNGRLLRRDARATLIAVSSADAIGSRRPASSPLDRRFSGELAPHAHRRRPSPARRERRRGNDLQVARPRGGRRQEGPAARVDRDRQGRQRAARARRRAASRSSSPPRGRSWR